MDAEALSVMELEQDQDTAEQTATKQINKLIDRMLEFAFDGIADKLTPETSLDDKQDRFDRLNYRPQTSIHHHNHWYCDSRHISFV